MSGIYKKVVFGVVGTVLVGAQLSLPHPYFFADAEWLTAFVVLVFYLLGYCEHLRIDSVIEGSQFLRISFVLLCVLASLFHFVAFRITDNVWFGGGYDYLVTWYVSAALASFGVGRFVRVLDRRTD